MRSVDDHASEPRRLKRVVPALWDECCTQEYDIRKAIEKAELAESIGEIAIGLIRRSLAARPPRDLQAETLQENSNLVAAVRVARDDDGQQIGIALLERKMRLADRRLLTFVGGRGQPSSASTEHVLQRRQLILAGRKRRCRRLEVSDGQDLACAEPREPFGIHVVLRKAQLECSEKRACRPHAEPVAERSLR